MARPDASGAVVAAEERGWLYKKAGKGKGYDRRYCVLDPTHRVLSYRKRPTGRVSGEIDLSQVTSIRGTDPVVHSKCTAAAFGFELVTQGRAWALFGESASARRRWVRAIAACASLTGGDEIDLDFVNSDLTGAARGGGGGSGGGGGGGGGGRGGVPAMDASRDSDSDLSAPESSSLRVLPASEVEAMSKQVEDLRQELRGRDEKIAELKRTMKSLRSRLEMREVNVATLGGSPALSGSGAIATSYMSVNDSLEEVNERRRCACCAVS